MLSEMPEGWTAEQLQNLCYRPISYGVLKPGDFFENGRPMLRIQDVKTDFEPSLIWKISAELDEEYKRTRLNKGDIIFSVVGTLGETKLIDDSLVGANISRAFAVVGADTKKVNISYLHQFLKSSAVASWVAQTGRGGAQKVVNLGELRGLNVPIPPFNEQERIAEILESVDTSIKATNAVIDQAERAKQGLMEELLTGSLGSEAVARGEVPDGWVLNKLGDTGKLYAGGTPNRKTPEFYQPPEIPWVKSGELRQGEITQTEEKISSLGLEKSSAKLVPAGTPVLAMYGATAGEVGWLTIEAATNQAVLACEPAPHVDAKFLYYSLVNASALLIARQQGGAQPNLSKKLVSSFEFALPPLKEQRRIAAILSNVDEFIAKQKAIIKQQALSKRGLMDDLLTGTVRTV